VGGSSIGGVFDRGFVGGGSSTGGLFDGGFFGGGSSIGGLFDGGFFDGGCFNGGSVTGGSFTGGCFFVISLVDRIMRELVRCRGFSGIALLATGIGRRRQQCVGAAQRDRRPAAQQFVIGAEILRRNDVERDEVIVRVEHGAAMTAPDLSLAKRELRGGHAKHRRASGASRQLLLVHCGSSRAASRRRTPPSSAQSSSVRQMLMSNHGANAVATSSTCATRMPANAIDPPSTVCAASAGASIRNGLARMFATTLSKRALAFSASTSTNVASTSFNRPFAMLDLT